MANYTLEHRNIAFSVYRRIGAVNETYRELKKDPRFPKTFNKSTLLRWKEELDERGKNWEDRLKEINIVKNEISDRDFAKEKDKAIKEVRQMMDLLFQKSLETPVKTAEGAARTYAVLLEQYNKLTGIDISKEQFVLMYKTILECFASHPVVGPVIKQYWNEIEVNLNLEYEKIKK